MLVQWFNDRTILERILAVNLAIIILMSALGLVTLNHFNQVIGIGQRIEDHPLVVSNAVLEIEVDVSDLNGYLKTALTTRSLNAITTYNNKIDQVSAGILDNLLLIEDRFLGDPNLPREATVNFLDWKRHNARMMKALSSGSRKDIIERSSRESWLSRDLLSDYLTEINIVAHKQASGFIAGLQDQRRGAVAWTVLLILAAAMLATGLSVLVGHSVADPIRFLQRVMSALAKGDLDVYLPEARSARFEACAIGTAAAAMKANAQEKNRLIERAECARIKAEKANQAKSRFLAMMSHELRTPMNAILGSAQVLDAMQLEDELREHVDTLTTGGETLMDILNDVLDLSKIESGKLTVECTDFDIRASLEQAKTLWAPRAGDKGLTLNIHIEDNAPQWIHSDTTRIRQILFNLLSNAIKFTQDGQIDVVLRQIGLRDGEAQLEIAVKDTGLGIDADKLERLFNPFEQEDDSITRRFGGTGLGLTISRQLATLLGGTLTVTSEKEKGSTFTLGFCAAECVAPAIKEPSKAKTAASARKLSILVAEDNAINLKVLRALLKPFPYDLVHAENGAIALELLNSRVFDLVLMDIQMPILDGIGATQQLRAGNGPNKNAPVIAMTANAMEGDRESYIAAGMTGYVPKPIDARQLFTSIARAAAEGHRNNEAAADSATQKTA